MHLTTGAEVMHELVYGCLDSGIDGWIGEMVSEDRGRTCFILHSLIFISRTTFSGVQMGLSYSHFHYVDFEVIARNIPERRVQELDHMLCAFAASLKSTRL